MDAVKYTPLTRQERREIRLRYIEEQGGECWYCHGKLEKDPPKWVTDRRINWKCFPPGFRDYPIHLHHDHKTDLTIGAVHAYCNAVLWQYYGQ